MKMEFDLNEEQMEKVKILEENNISIGEAIDLLFEMKEDIAVQTNMILDSRIAQATEEKKELEAKLERIDKDLSVFEKLKDNTLDIEEKQKLVEKQYAAQAPTYDRSVQDVKHNLKWSTKFFKF